MNEAADRPAPRLLKLAQIVPGLVPVNKATLWRWIRQGKFPAPIKFVARPRFWLESDVFAWMYGTWVSPARELS